MVGIPPRPTGIAMVNHEAVSDTATDDARPHTKKETITGDVVNEIKNLQEVHTSKLITHILKKFEKKINRKDLKEICGQIDERFRSGKPKPTGPHSKINLRKNIADDYNLACSTPSPLVKLTASPSLKRGARLNTRRGSTNSDRHSTTKQSFKISTSDHTTRQSYKISSPSSSPSPSPSFVKTTKQSFKISSSSEIPLPKHHHSFKVASVSSSDPQLNKKSSFKVSSKAAAIGSLDDMAGPFSSPVQKVKSTKLRKTLSESNATLKEPHQNNSKDAEVCKENYVRNRIFQWNKLQEKAYCRLCGKEKESRYCEPLFSEKAKENDLVTKVVRTCGVDIKENDPLPKVICRLCEKFVSKMSDFRKMCQRTQLKFSFKRSVMAAPRLALPAPPLLKDPIPKELKRRDSKDLNLKNKRNKRLMIGQVPSEININLISMVAVTEQCNAEEVDSPVDSEKIDDEPESVYSLYHDSYVSQSLTSDEREKLAAAISTERPSEIALAILNECPTIAHLIKKRLLKAMHNSCTSFGEDSASVLHNQFRDDNNAFDTERIYSEIRSIIPFFIDILNSVAGEELDFDRTGNELRMKYSLIYAILMEVRWTNLSLISKIIASIIKSSNDLQLQFMLRGNDSSGKKEFLRPLITGRFTDMKYAESGIRSNTYILNTLKGQDIQDCAYDDYHIFSSDVYENLVTFLRLSRCNPKADIRLLPTTKYIHSESSKDFENSAKEMANQIFPEIFTTKNVLKNIIPDLVSQQYSKDISPSTDKKTYKEIVRFVNKRTFNVAKEYRDLTFISPDTITCEEQKSFNKNNSSTTFDGSNEENDVFISLENEEGQVETIEKKQYSEKKERIPNNKNEIYDSIVDSDVRIVDRDEQISDKDEHIVDSDEHISDRDEPIVDSDGEISNRDEYIVDKDEKSSDRDEPIADSDGQITDRDEHIVDSNGQISDRDEYIVDSDEQISDRDEPIVDRDGQITDIDEHIVDSDGQISDRDEPIIDSDEQILDGDEHNEDNDDQILDRDEHIVDSDEQISDRDEHIVDSDEQISDLNEQNCEGTKQISDTDSISSSVIDSTIDMSLVGSDNNASLLTVSNIDLMNAKDEVERSVPTIVPARSVDDSTTQTSEEEFLDSGLNESINSTTFDIGVDTSELEDSHTLNSNAFEIEFELSEMDQSLQTNTVETGDYLDNTYESIDEDMHDKTLDIEIDDLDEDSVEDLDDDMLIELSNIPSDSTEELKEETELNSISDSSTASLVEYEIINENQCTPTQDEIKEAILVDTEEAGRAKITLISSKIVETSETSSENYKRVIQEVKNSNNCTAMVKRSNSNIEIIKADPWTHIQTISELKKTPLHEHSHGFANNGSKTISSTKKKRCANVRYSEGDNNAISFRMTVDSDVCGTYSKTYKLRNSNSESSIENNDSNNIIKSSKATHDTDDIKIVFVNTEVMITTLEDDGKGGKEWIVNHKKDGAAFRERHNYKIYDASDYLTDKSYYESPNQYETLYIDDPDKELRDGDIVSKKGGSKRKHLRLENNSKSSSEHKERNRSKKKRSKDKKRFVYIIGDGMLRTLRGIDLKRKLNTIDSIFVRCFPGATTNEMVSYSKTTMEKNPSCVILHCGTNDLPNGTTANEIAINIVELASILKNQCRDIMISGIVPRRDRWDVKRQMVNMEVRNKCAIMNIAYRDHHNIDKEKDLDKTGVNLNKRGSNVLFQNYIDTLESFEWSSDKRTHMA